MRWFFLKAQITMERAPTLRHAVFESALSEMQFAGAHFKRAHYF
jgi:hypothetical protein